MSRTEQPSRPSSRDSVPSQGTWEIVNINDLTDDERAFVSAKRASLGRTVPNVETPVNMYIWALRVRGELVGAFTFVPFVHFGTFWGEAGLRIWQPSRTVLDAGRHWLAWLLETNAYVIGRVYPTNAPVLKLLQQLGFALVGYTGDLDGAVLDVYRLERGKLMGPRPRKDITDA